MPSYVLYFVNLKSNSDFNKLNYQIIKIILVRVIIDNIELLVNSNKSFIIEYENK